MIVLTLCHRCGKPVCLEGNIADIDGFYENVAPHAASGGSMMPMHWKCSSLSPLSKSPIIFKESA